MKINVNFHFDFEKEFEKALHDDETYQNISYAAQCFNVDKMTAEAALRCLISANVKIFSSVLEKSNAELLNEIAIDDSSQNV